MTFPSFAEWVIIIVVLSILIVFLVSNANAANKKYEDGKREGKTMKEVDKEQGNG